MRRYKEKVTPQNGRIIPKTFSKSEDYGPNSSANRFQVCISLELLSIEKRASLLTSTMLRDICTCLQRANLTANLPPSQFDLAKIESELLGCDYIIIICSSVASDLEIYDRFKN